MKLTLTNPVDRHGGSVTKVLNIHVEHDKQSFDVMFNAYLKTTLKDADGFFKEINAYFEQLPLNIQQSLFDVYKDINDAFDDVMNYQVLYEELKTLVARFYSLIPWGHYVGWLQRSIQLNMPQDGSVPDDFTGLNERHYKRETTYVKSEYWELIALSMYLRPMIGVFGRYMDISTAGTNMKEYKAYKLLDKSEIKNLAPMKQFIEYVEALVSRESIPTSSIIGGLGTSELPLWLVSRTIVRKVAVTHQEDNIIKIVYTYITQQLKSLNSKFKGLVRDKRVDGGGNEEDNISVFENIKVKQVISDGDLVVLSTYTEDYVKLAHLVDPTVDPARVELCVQNARTGMAKRSEVHQKTLTQWVMSHVLPPKAIPTLNKQALLRSIGITQSILWHWGFLDLALLLTVERVITDHMVFTPNTRSNLSKHYPIEFAKLYPHYREPTSRNKDVRHQNVAYIAIEGKDSSNDPKKRGLAGHITAETWKPNGPKPLMVELGLPPRIEFYQPPVDIRDHLAELIIKINQVYSTN